MTIESTTFRTSYLTADGVNDLWPYAFTIYASDSIVVLVRDEDGVITEHTSNFTWIPTNDTSGFVQYPVTGAKVPATSEVRLERRVPYLQPTAIGNQGAFYPVTHERSFDRSVIHAQQLDDITSRALVKRVDGTEFNAEGRRIVNVADPVDDADVATLGWAGTFRAEAIAARDAALAAQAAAEAVYDTFDDRYLGPKATAPIVDNDGAALVVGTLYFDTTTGSMRVYSSSGWGPAAPATQVYRLQTYQSSDATLVDAQTTFAVTGGFDPAYVQVFLNGVKLVNGQDVTISSGTDVVFATGLTTVDVLQVLSFNSFNVANVLAGDVQFTPSGTGAVLRTADAKLKETPVSLKDFGAVGNYTTDDTAAVSAWLTYLGASGRPGYVPAGVYRCTNNLVLPEGLVAHGVYAPKIATFPQTGGEKNKLRPGLKGTIRGSVFIFSGTPTNTVTTTRSDRFASIKPCMIYDHYPPPDLRDFAIIQDMDVFDADGLLTTAATDNRASDYTAGLLLKCTKGSADRLTVFGYFAVQGTIVANVDGDALADPDYNELTSCYLSSGLAIVGADTPAASEGLTGLRTIGGVIYGADHHTRADTNPDIPTLYIDGNLTTAGEIRGHSFVGTAFRGNANNAIVLDHCDDVTFAACVTEFSTVAGVAGLDTNGKIVATANTQNVRMFGMAATADLGLAALAATIKGKFQLIGAGGIADRAYFGEGGKAVVLFGDASTGDSIIQLTDDFTSVNAQWTIRRDDDVGDLLDFRYGGATAKTLSTTGLDRPNIIQPVAWTRLPATTILTIASGAVTANRSNHRISNGGAAGDLHTISGGTDGDLLYLRPNVTADAITFKHAGSGGNIRTRNGADFLMSGAFSMVVLMFDGTNWRIIN